MGSRRRRRGARVTLKVNLDTESAQMPKMGMSWEMAHFRLLIVSLHCDGSPGPLLQKRPSHFKLALRGIEQIASTASEPYGCSLAATSTPSTRPRRLPETCEGTAGRGKPRVRLQIIIEGHHNQSDVVRLDEVSDNIVLHACAARNAPRVASTA